MKRVEDVRRRLQQILEEYFQVEAELKSLEADRFRVCIFGSARIRPEDNTYWVVYRMSRSLARMGVDIVTGGGPGLMEAANRGQRDARNKETLSYGLTIELPSAHELANKHLDIKSEHKRFSSRLDEFMRLSHAVIVAPGGIGTLLELVYVWQLIQVGLAERRAIVLLGEDMWGGLLDWMREKMLAQGYVGPNDFDHVHLVKTPAEALTVIRAELERFKTRQEEKPDGEESAEQARQMLEVIDRSVDEPQLQEPFETEPESAARAG